MEVISRDGTTAQIDPLRFCEWLLKQIMERGVNVHQPVRATSVIQDQDGVLSGVRIQAGEDAGSQTECKMLDRWPSIAHMLTNSQQYHVLDL